MSVYLDPDKLTHEQRQAVDRWLVANGCRWNVALEPVVLAGQWVRCTTFTLRRDRPNSLKLERRHLTMDGGFVALKTRVRWFRVRVPLVLPPDMEVDGGI